MSTKEFHFVKSVDIQLATDDWVNNRRLGSKVLLCSIRLSKTLKFFKEYFIKEKYSAGNLKDLLLKHKESYTLHI